MAYFGVLFYQRWYTTISYGMNNDFYIEAHFLLFISALSLIVTFILSTDNFAHQTCYIFIL